MSGRNRKNRILRLLTAGVALVAVAACVVLLRPVSLGGPAGYTIVSGSSMSPTLESGDLAVTMKQRTYAVGDLVVYEIPRGEVGEGIHVVHRIVGGTAWAGFVVRGDAKDAADPWRPTADDVIGKLVVTAPRVGTGLVFLRTGLGLALLAGLATTLLALAALRAPTARPDAPPG